MEKAIINIEKDLKIKELISVLSDESVEFVSALVDSLRLRQQAQRPLWPIEDNRGFDYSPTG
jgi:hypothetical protein